MSGCSIGAKELQREVAALAAKTGRERRLHQMKLSERVGHFSEDVATQAYIAARSTEERQTLLGLIRFCHKGEGRFRPLLFYIIQFSGNSAERTLAAKVLSEERSVTEALNTPVVLVLGDALNREQDKHAANVIAYSLYDFLRSACGYDVPGGMRDLRKIGKLQVRSADTEVMRSWWKTTGRDLARNGAFDDSTSAESQAAERPAGGDAALTRALVALIAVERAWMDDSIDVNREEAWFAEERDGRIRIRLRMTNAAHEDESRWTQKVIEATYDDSKIERSPLLPEQAKAQRVAAVSIQPETVDVRMWTATKDVDGMRPCSRAVLCLVRAYLSAVRSARNGRLPLPQRIVTLSEETDRWVILVRRFGGPPYNGAGFEHSNGAIIIDKAGTSARIRELSVFPP